MTTVKMTPKYATNVQGIIKFIQDSDPKSIAVILRKKDDTSLYFSNWSDELQTVDTLIGFLESAKLSIFNHNARGK